MVEHGLPHELSHFRSLLQIFLFPVSLTCKHSALGWTGAPDPVHSTISPRAQGTCHHCGQEDAALISQVGKLRVGVSGDQVAQGHRKEQAQGKNPAFVWDCEGF